VKTRFYTDFLAPESGFVEGMGTVLNICGNYYTYNYSPSDEEADATALRKDWESIGQDFRRALIQNKNTVPPMTRAEN
jgi:hypothetical protein